MGNPHTVGENGMAIAAIEWAFNQPTPNPSAKLVLLALADHADEHGHCWPGIGRIEQRTGLSRSTVIRALAELETGRLIERTRRGSTSNSYNLIGIKVSSLKCHHDISSGVTMTPKPSVEPSKKPNKARAQVTAMTEDWQPDGDLIIWALGSFPIFNTEDLKDATDRFRDHWISKAERRADWRASWRNWIRNDAKFAARSRPAARLDRVRTTNAERINAAMDRHGVSRPAEPGRSHLRLVADRDSGH
jgi:DNA-binding transcriptional MocR family regulator